MLRLAIYIRNIRQSKHAVYCFLVYIQFFFTNYKLQKKCECKVLVAQSCPTLCNPMDCSTSGSSVHGILQIKILEWATIPFSRESSQPRGQTWVSCNPSRFFTFWAIREVLRKLIMSLQPRVLYNQHCMAI